MSVKLAIAGQPPTDFNDEQITLGSDPSCTVPMTNVADVQPKHAVIRSIAGRWLIEVREGESIFVGTAGSRRLHWLNPGDEIRLTESSPVIVFQPQPGSAAPRSTVPVSVTSFAPLSDGPPPSPPRHSPPPPPPPPPAPKKSADLPLTDTVVIPLDSDPELPTYGRGASAPLSSPPPGKSSGSKSGTHSTVTASHSASDEQNSDAPSGHGPLLQRMATSQDASDNGSFGFSQDPELTPEQRELRWIVSVIGKAVGAGLIFVLLYVAIEGLRKAFTPDRIDSIRTSAVETPHFDFKPTVFTEIT